MTTKTDREKLRILLIHWVGHNKEHAEEFRRWAERAGQLGEMDVSSDLGTAVKEMERVNNHLLAALDKLGGSGEIHY